MSFRHFYSISFAVFCLILRACISAEEETVNLVATIDTPQTDSLGYRRLRHELDLVEKNKDTSEERVLPESITKLLKLDEKNVLKRILRMHETWPYDNLRDVINEIIGHKHYTATQLRDKINQIRAEAEQEKNEMDVARADQFLNLLGKRLD